MRCRDCVRILDTLVLVSSCGMIRFTTTEASRAAAAAAVVLTKMVRKLCKSWRWYGPTYVLCPPFPAPLNFFPPGLSSFGRKEGNFATKKNKKDRSDCAPSDVSFSRRMIDIDPVSFLQGGVCFSAFLISASSHDGSFAMEKLRLVRLNHSRTYRHNMEHDHRPLDRLTTENSRTSVKSERCWVP